VSLCSSMLWGYGDWDEVADKVCILGVQTWAMEVLQMSWRHGVYVLWDYDSVDIRTLVALDCLMKGLGPVMLYL
jgi:hypothetical protein